MQNPVFRGLLAGLLVAAGAATPPAHAQGGLYRCLEGGRTVFQQQPCAAGATTVQAQPARIAPAWPWTGLKPGMDVAAVAQRQNAQPANGGRLASGAETRLAKPLKIAGADYRARWFFTDAGLAQVNVDAAGETLDNAEVKARMEALRPLLAAEFGRPVKDDLEQTPTMLRGGSSWTLPGGGRAWLSAVPVTAGTSLLTFGWQPVTMAAQAAQGVSAAAGPLRP